MKLNTQFYPVQTVQGQRIVLKEITIIDAQALLELRSNEGVMIY